MPRVLIKYSCGCEASPYVTWDYPNDLVIHPYDVDFNFCKKHQIEAFEKVKDKFKNNT